MRVFIQSRRDHDVLSMRKDAPENAVGYIIRIDGHCYRKWASVISDSRAAWSTGVCAPDGGKLGVTGVAMPDASSAMKRTR